MGIAYGIYASDEKNMARHSLMNVVPYSYLIGLVALLIAPAASVWLEAVEGFHLPFL